MKIPTSILAFAAVLATTGLSLSASTLTEAQVPSPSMGKKVPCSVILPDAYAKDTARRFPVVYMLHGAGGNHLSMPNDGVIGRLADVYGFIAVCPDGERTCWWIDSPVDPTMKYETFVSAELPAYVDATYRSRAEKGGRAIMGGSRGGHGACWNGIRHRDVFGAIGNIYGGVDLRPFPRNWEIHKRLGTIEEHPENWEKFSVVSLAPALKNGEINLLTVVGTGDFFLNVNRYFHDILSANKVEHYYLEVRGADDAHSMHTGPFSAYAQGVISRFFANYFATGRASLF